MSQIFAGIGTYPPSDLQETAYADIASVFGHNGTQGWIYKDYWKSNPLNPNAWFMEHAPFESPAKIIAATEHWKLHPWVLRQEDRHEM